MNRKYNFVVALLAFICFCDASSSPSPNEEVSKMGFANGEEPYCSLESCQELRKRVESLEGAVRAIVSALSDEKNRHFISVSQKIGENRAVRSVLSPSSTSDDVLGEENQTTSETPPTSPLPKSRIIHVYRIIYFYLTTFTCLSIYISKKKSLFIIC